MKKPLVEKVVFKNLRKTDQFFLEVDFLTILDFDVLARGEQGLKIVRKTFYK